MAHSDLEAGDPPPLVELLIATNRGCAIYAETTVSLRPRRDSSGMFIRLEQSSLVEAWGSSGLRAAADQKIEILNSCQTSNQGFVWNLAFESPFRWSSFSSLAANTDNNRAHKSTSITVLHQPPSQ